MINEIETAESAAMEKFVDPADMEVVRIINKNGELVVRSDVGYERAGAALVVIRSKRRELATYFKEPAPETGAGPGQGLCFHARKAWEGANSLFNRFNKHLLILDQNINEEMSRYRAEVEKKAREEAERVAANERERLRKEAEEQTKIAAEQRRTEEEKLRKEREAAEAERKRLEAIAAEERRKAEAERQARLKAEMAAANSEAAQSEAKRKAEAEEVRLEAEARQAQEEAEDARRAQEIAEAESRRLMEERDAQAKAEAEEKLREAENVIAVLGRDAPTAQGTSVRTKWKAELLSLDKLVTEICAGRAPITCIEFSQGESDKLAQAWGGLNAPAGLRFVKRETTVVRRREP